MWAWEYCFVILGLSLLNKDDAEGFPAPDYDGALEGMNAQGADGWEAFAILTPDGWKEPVVLMKRPVPRSDAEERADHRQMLLDRLREAEARGDVDEALAAQEALNRLLSGKRSDA